jgi:hypothetical protein
MTDTAFVAPGIRARLERGWQSTPAICPLDN